ncbi:MAG: radical SAM protein [Candidatus Thermoplasmatota archaeon]|nr:radical SAM protein [Candidatus Thermoplasmatota archaeon]
MKVHEIFYSLQGEGAYMGTPTIFVRTTGCNLRCSFCDTTYAYTRGKELTIPQILKKVKDFPYTMVCITGGEPLLQKQLPTLVDRLVQHHYTILLETNGSLDIRPYTKKTSVIISLDIKCPSSRMHQNMNFDNIPLLKKTDQLKFIINNKHDYEYAKGILVQYRPCCAVFFQPVWGTNPKRLAAWILHDGLPVRLGVQLQKIIWGAKRGV